MHVETIIFTDLAARTAWPSMAHKGEHIIGPLLRLELILGAERVETVDARL